MMTTVLLTGATGYKIYRSLVAGTYNNRLLATVVGGEEFDYRPLLSFSLGLAAAGAGFMAMGLFFSSITRNQIIAAVLSFVGMIERIMIEWQDGELDLSIDQIIDHLVAMFLIGGAAAGVTRRPAA